MGSAQRSDEELMQQVRQGQREALSALLRRYASGLLTFIHRMNGDAHHSEELFQEVFLAVWTSRRRYQYPRSFRSWLFGIAANKCYAERRRPVQPQYQESQPEVPVVAGDDPTPVEAAIATEHAVIVEQAVLRLPPQQRSVVVLRIWNGYSYGAIANILDFSESTARSTMSHALAAMRKYLEPRMRSSTTPE
jgi:RNA polymerase sigma-70 factor (ECF subfamily)